SLHTRLVRELTRRGAKLIVFDVLWSEPSTNSLVDQELTEAIREHGRVVLAAHWRKLPDFPGLQQVESPAKVFATNASWGLVEWPINPGESQMIRRQFYHPDYANMPWQAAAILTKAPPDRVTGFWMNYYGPPGTVRTYCFSGGDGLRRRSDSPPALGGNFNRVRGVDASDRFEHICRLAPPSLVSLAGRLPGADTVRPGMGLDCSHAKVGPREDGTEARS